MTNFYGMGIPECDLCGAYTKDKIECEYCGDYTCRWCEDTHPEECSYHRDICPDHPCERCVDRYIDAAMAWGESQYDKP